jgi:hypothetical protein
VPGLLVLVARLLGADLGGRQRLVGLAQRGLDLGLLAGARPQRRGHALPRLAVGGELGVGRPDPDGEDLEGGGERGGEALGPRDERALALELAGQEGDALIALGALAGPALGVAPLGGQLPSTWARRTAVAASSGARRRWAMVSSAWRTSSWAAERARSASRAARSASSRAASAAATACDAVSTAARAACSAATAPVGLAD